VSQCSGLIRTNFKMSNLVFIRITIALNCVNRGHGREFLFLLFTFDAFLLIFFTNFLYRIVANYLNYIINKEKIYVDYES
jgi:hypothetical protein